MRSNIKMPKADGRGDPTRIAFVDQIGSFLPALKGAAEKMNMTVAHVEGIVNPETYNSYGTVWCSWADPLAIQISEYAHLLPGKFVIQVRSYEAYNEEWMKAIKWENVDCLVYVADHIAQRVIRTMKWWEEEGGIRLPETVQLPEGLNTALLPTCLDLKKWPKPAKWDKIPNQVAWVGRFCPPKNPELLFFLAQCNPGLDFVAIGPHTDPRFEDFVNSFEFDVKNLRIINNKEQKFWENMDPVRTTLAESSYILSTAYHESTCVALMEGMAMGCQPIVYDRDGIWVDGNYIFQTIEDFRDMTANDVTSRESDEHRNFIATHRDIHIHDACFKNIMENLHPQLKEV